jgi:plasmid stability protein
MMPVRAVESSMGSGSCPTVPTPFHLDDDLHLALEVLAQARRRSLNQEINDLLRLGLWHGLQRIPAGPAARWADSSVEALSWGENPPIAGGGCQTG